MRNAQGIIRRVKKARRRSRRDLFWGGQIVSSDPKKIPRPRVDKRPGIRKVRGYLEASEVWEKWWEGVTDEDRLFREYERSQRVWKAAEKERIAKLGRWERVKACLGFEVERKYIEEEVGWR